MAIQHQWEAWPKNAVTPGNWRAVDPARPWVPSPESQPFPLPPEHDDPKHARIVPPVRQRPPIGQRSSRPRQQREEDPLRRKPSRLSVRYWLDWLGTHVFPG
ncbi:hypothetical protein PHLGIDRAFT_255204 [Phlebiopsis gigantea 11061_1 CR5-6]|uniref:Uncharacterized protein n=1 Tax=Phlebiopsis gigantea (strain 11061_1 CR5-6) TaxID=745531 RepID=A0A0C3S4Q0_PHLG1|nr:hypothetical protein PHLGIDRAFT_255204 [Phlebiopsis gigantea 11061_1 CR5-6]